MLSLIEVPQVSRFEFLRNKARYTWIMDISHCSVIGIGRISVGLLTCTCRWCQSEKKTVRIWVSELQVQQFKIHRKSFLRIRYAVLSWVGRLATILIRKKNHCKLSFNKVHKEVTRAKLKLCVILSYVLLIHLIKSDT